MSAEEVITSVRNPAVAAAVRLHRARHRRAERRTLVEGPVVVSEAARAALGLVEVFGVGNAARLLAGKVGAVYRPVTDHVLGRLAGTESPRGPVAVIDIPEPMIPADRRLLVAWGVSDPGNCGTLLRTAAAFGYGFVTGPKSADAWSPKVLRSAAGGHFRTTVGEVLSVSDLSDRYLIGTVASGGEPAGPVATTTAIIVGSETHGLPPEVLASCRRLVSIPMPGGTESLNVAVAGAIVAYIGAGGDQEA